MRKRAPALDARESVRACVVHVDDEPTPYTSQSRDARESVRAKRDTESERDRNSDVSIP